MATNWSCIMDHHWNSTPLPSIMRVGDLIKSAILCGSEWRARSHCSEQRKEAGLMGRQLQGSPLIDGPRIRLWMYRQMVLNAWDFQLRQQLFQQPLPPHLVVTGHWTETECVWMHWQSDWMYTARHLSFIIRRPAESECRGRVEEVGCGGAGKGRAAKSTLLKTRPWNWSRLERPTVVVVALEKSGWLLFQSPEIRDRTKPSLHRLQAASIP